jgi:hypothetical protein
MARATRTAARLQLIARTPASQDSKHLIKASILPDTNHVMSKHLILLSIVSNYLIKIPTM